MSNKKAEILTGFLMAAVVIGLLYLFAAFVNWDMRISKWNVWIRFIYVIFSIAACSDIYVITKKNIMGLSYGKEPIDPLYSICDDINTTASNISDLFTEKLNELKTKR